MRQTVGILGTPVDVLDTDAVLGRLEQFIEEGRFHQIATANTDFLINAVEDPELRFILRRADLVIPDGMPLVWASRLFGSPLPERVTGADLVPQLAALSAVKGYRVFMLGARPEIAQRARKKMESDHPGLQIVGCVSPPVAPLLGMDHGAILDEIRAARPDILLVAFGNPKQEKWIHMHRKALADVPICIGIGGTFDFIAGHTSRAPRWMQKTGMEWIYRLKQEPRRLAKRYARDLSLFRRHLFRQWSAMRAQKRTASSAVECVTTGQFTILSVVGDLAGGSVSEVHADCERAFAAGTDLVLDLQQLTAIDATGLGMLINLSRRAAARDVEVRLAGVPAHIRRVLEAGLVVGCGLRLYPTLAGALTLSRRDRLTWEVRCGRSTALILAAGAAEHDGATRLETLCTGLLEAGRSVDIDFTMVDYADMYLLATLARMSAGARTGKALRIVPGEALGLLLQQQKASDRFTLLSSVANPLDTADDAVGIQAVL